VTLAVVCRDSFTVRIDSDAVRNHAVGSYAHKIGECAKRSPELIQLLELHTQFAAITPYTQVRSQSSVTLRLLVMSSSFYRHFICSSKNQAYVA